MLKFLQKLDLDFPYICLQFFPGNFYRKMYRNFKEGSRYSSECNGLIFFSRILKTEALVYNSYFFKTAVLRKLFDIGFSYKHCNFSRHVCLLVKLASKTVTRSIQGYDHTLLVISCPSTKTIPKRSSVYP